MGKIDGDMKTFGGMPFEEAQKRLAQLQARWDALSPEEQEVERKKTAPLYARWQAEMDYDDEDNESPN
jgi:hypothetical protein